MYDIRSRLEKILGKVQSPARYIGGEANSICKSMDDVEGSMVLIFPDTYEVGMSNNGYRILYHMINGQKDLKAEYAFAPWMDMAELMKENNIPVYSHETYTSIADFDVVGITLQTELNFTNVPYILELSNIPVWSAERTDGDPIVIGGGPVMSNPEPVADFYDAFLIGDGEVVAPQVVRMVGTMKKEGRSREQILLSLSELPGMYIPSLMKMQLSERGEWIPDDETEAKGSFKRTKGIKRTWVEVLDKNNYPIHNLIPNTKLVHDRFSVEVMRGCTQGCRFCQAGYWYRPNRELNPDHVIELAKAGLDSTGEKELGLLSLSTADYSQIEKVADILIDDEYFANIDVSLPSLRANSFGQGLAGKVAAMKNGGRSATFAPETGSERLRKIINKTISDQDMYNAAEGVFKNGFNKIKLYTMVGIPSENLEDMEAFCGLIQGLVDIGKKHNSRAQVHASIGVMVPKPFTPMQWVGFMEREKVEKHIRFVRDRFYKNSNVRISWTDWREAHVESFYSRGDRNLSQMIYAAYKKGMVFESYREKFSYDSWLELWKEFGYSTENVFRERSFDEIFPWDYIHAGIGKGYLKNEYKKMYQASEAVKDCKWDKTDCNSCGIPGNYQDIQLAEEPEKYKAPSRSIEEIKELAAERKIVDRESFSHQVVFAKQGLSRFLPHQNTLNFIEKAFTRLGLEIKYSQGFSPKPKIRSNGATPMGLATICEEVFIEFFKPLENLTDEFFQQLNLIFPRGMEILSIARQTSKKPRIPIEVEYYMDDVLSEERKLFVATEKINPLENHRGKLVDVQKEIISYREENRKTYVRARASQLGVTVSPFILYAGLMGVTVEDAREKLIVRHKVEF